MDQIHPAESVPVRNGQDVMNQLNLLKIVAIGLMAASSAVAGDSISFNQDIRPILSDRCFNCHGPDEEGRKSKLRLDTVEGSRKVLDDGWQVIKPGDPEKSELIYRVV